MTAIIISSALLPLVMRSLRTFTARRQIASLAALILVVILLLVKNAVLEKVITYVVVSGHLYLF